MDEGIGVETLAVASAKFTRVRSTDGRRVRIELLLFVIVGRGFAGSGREADGVRARYAVLWCDIEKMNEENCSRWLRKSEVKISYLEEKKKIFFVSVFILFQQRQSPKYFSFFLFVSRIETER